MSVSFVNGYTCYSSCDAATARSGKDPHPNSPDAGDDAAQKTGAAGPKRDNAVLFGGALAGLNSAAPAGANSPPAASAATGATPAVPGSQINRLL